MKEIRHIGRHFISDGEFNRMLLDILAWASEYIEGKEAANPLVLAVHALADGNHELNILIPLEFGGERAREIMIAIGAKAAESDDPLVAAFLVTEAWMTTRPAAAGPPELPPSEDPERIEALVISGSTIDQRQNQVVVRIERCNGLMQAGKVMSVPIINDGADGLQNRLLMQFWCSYAEELMLRRRDGG
jgi:hypothetical protein